MLDFIYNEGSTAHRGVWHVTDNLEVQAFEASDTIENSRYHGKPVRTIVKAPYEIAKGRAICGQVECQTGSLGFGSYSYESPDGTRHRRWKANGDIFVITYRPHRANYQRGLDNPPGPLCSRCEKKAGLSG